MNNYYRKLCITLDVLMVSALSCQLCYNYANLIVCGNCNHDMSPITRRHSNQYSYAC